MVDMTLIRPLNKGQGHSFWYFRTFDLIFFNSGALPNILHYITLPIDFSYVTSYRLSVVTFAPGRTV